MDNVLRETNKKKLLKINKKVKKEMANRKNRQKKG